MKSDNSVDFAALRQKMVQEQICARGIADQAVIAAMSRIHRHEFVPKDLQERAYEDCPISIGEGQTISQPYMAALMTQCLELNREKRVLEV